jgi:hypothetical protein
VKKSRDLIRMFKNEPEERRKSIYDTVQYLGERGFHAHTISKVAGISISQVYTACRQMQIRLRDYRDGFGKPAVDIVRVVTTTILKRVQTV